jgi:DNA-binding protein
MKEVYYMSKEQNIIYVGSKPAMSYVLAVITSYNSSDTKEVTLKARGRSIKTAVDVAEIVKRRFMKDLKTDKITIGTEELPQQEGGTRNVSTMEITLTRT